MKRQSRPACSGLSGWQPGGCRGQEGRTGSAPGAAATGLRCDAFPSISTSPRRKKSHTKMVLFFFSLAIMQHIKSNREHKKGSPEVKQRKKTVNDAPASPSPSHPPIWLCSDQQPPALFGEDEVTRPEDACTVSPHRFGLQALSAPHPPPLSAPIPLSPLVSINRNIQERRF